MTGQEHLRAVCGCRWRMVNDIFVFEPCSTGCSLYSAFLETASEEGKPVTTLDLR